MPSSLIQATTSLPLTVMEYWTWILGALVLYVLITTLRSGFRQDLRTIPGPFLARFTRLFLFFHAVKGNGHTLYQDLHRKYGRIVRVGPNKISVSDPDLISKIYGIDNKYKKSAFYAVFTASYRGGILDNVFATQDTTWHRNMRGLVSHAYSSSYLRQLEPFVDEYTIKFTSAMADLAGQPIDLGEWLQWYAFDVIGMITFSQSFGFINGRKDRFGVIDGLEAGTKYNTVIGQVPELHSWLLGNGRLVDLLMAVPALAKANPITTLKKMTNEAIASYDTSDSQPRHDYLEFLRKTQAKSPGRLSDRDLATSLFTNLFAGSDTTAIALRAIFYFLIKNPETYQSLVHEIEEADRDGRLSPVIEYQQGLKLPYLQAVIKEALRLHPAVAMPLERVIPDGGADLCGVFVPRGTVVGMHAWVIHSDEGVFGEEVEQFRPRRWLDAGPEQLKRMERCFLAFGSGTRTCLGKHISMLEMTKFVPQLLRQIDLEWASPRDKWEISGYWFAKQSGLVVRFVPKV